MKEGVKCHPSALKVGMVIEQDPLGEPLGRAGKWAWRIGSEWRAVRGASEKEERGRGRACGVVVVCIYIMCGVEKIVISVI